MQTSAAPRIRVSIRFITAKLVENSNSLIMQNKDKNMILRSFLQAKVLFE